MNKRLAEEEKLQKVEMTKLKAANALYNKKLKEERRVATAAKREERARRRRPKKPLRQLLERQPKTPLHLSKLPRRVSAKPHRYQLQRASGKNVLVVPQHLLKSYLLLQPMSPAAAALLSCQLDTHDLSGTNCSP
jgi:hypothetical protein